MKELAIVKAEITDWEKLALEIIKFMREFYTTVLPEKPKVFNTDDVLEEALLSDRVHYNGEKFTGRFNAKISRRLQELGAKWDKRSSAWKLSLNSLPPNIVMAASQGNSRNAQRVKELIDRLNDFKSSKKFQSDIIAKTVESTSKKIDASTKNITVVPSELDPQQKEQIVKKYTENMDLDIKKWSDEKIISLRKKVEKSTLKGIRYEDLVKSLAKEFEGDVAHARFVARQETHLLVAEIKEQQSRKAGLNRYKWKTLNFPTGDNKGDVRPDHAHLNGEIFDWDNPPIVDQRTGKRGHPGQDFNCRCIAILVVE